MAKNQFITLYGRITAIEEAQGKKGPFLRVDIEDTLGEVTRVGAFKPEDFGRIRALQDKALVRVWAAPINAFGKVRLYRILTIEGWSEEEILVGEGVIDHFAAEVRAEVEELAA